MIWRDSVNRTVHSLVRLAWLIQIKHLHLWSLYPSAKILVPQCRKNIISCSRDDVSYITTNRMLLTSIPLYLLCRLRKNTVIRKKVPYESIYIKLLAFLIH